MHQYLYLIGTVLGDTSPQISSKCPPMGIFKGRYHYILPERLAPDEIRQRRLVNMLDRERKALEVEPSRLSPANTFHLAKLKETQSRLEQALEARTREFVSTPEFKSQSRVKQVAMLRLFRSQQPENPARLRRAAVEQRRRGYLATALASSSNPFYMPSARNMFSNTEAKVIVRNPSQMFFWNPLKAFPCVQRMVRKQVMFAKKKAGKGYRTRKRRGPHSDIGC